MTRMRSSFWRSIWLALGLAFGVAPASACLPHHLVKVGEAPRADAPRVLILRSSASPVYDPVISAFVSQMEEEAAIYTCDLDESVFGLRQEVERLRPNLILALGTKATLFANDSLSDVPLVFTMVVDYRRFEHLLSHPAAGVAMEVAPQTEFGQFRLVVPDVKRVLAFYVASESQDLVTIAATELSKMGIKLLAVPVHNAEEIPAKLPAFVGQADALWLLDDPQILNATTFDLLRDTALAKHLPLLASFSDAFARGGALVSLSIDLPSVGFQASGMARQILQGVTAAQLGVQPPIGAKLVLNLTTAKAIGLTVSGDVLPFVDIVGNDVAAPATLAPAPRTQP